MNKPFATVRVERDGWWKTRRAPTGARIAAAAVCLWASAVGLPRASAVSVGDARETVLQELGPPRGAARRGDVEILLFNEGMIEIRDGRVISSSMPGQGQQTTAPARQSADLVLYYPFGEAGPVVHDHSGRDNHGRSHGVDVSPQGRHGPAGLFNGRNAFLQTSVPVDLEPPYTVTAWVYLRSKLDAGGDFSNYRGRTILARGDLNRSGAWDYIFNVNAYGKLGFVTHSAFSRADTLQNPDPFPLNRWVFVAFTHEGATGKLYQDGRMVRQNAQMQAGNRHKGPGTFVGKIFNTHPPSKGDHFWDGMIDEVRIFSAALSENEVRDVYALNRAWTAARAFPDAAPPEGAPAELIRARAEPPPADGRPFRRPTLFDAVDENDVEDALRHVRAGADVTVRDEDGETPLHWAAASAGARMVTLLLDHGADIHARGRIEEELSDATPLHAAVLEKNVETARVLLSRGADPNAVARAEVPGDSRDLGRTITPLHLAVGIGHKDIVALLLDHGAKLHAAATFYDGRGVMAGATPLHLAAMANAESLVELLLARGADILARTSDGMTALTLAEAEGHVDVVQLLRMRGGSH